MIKLLAFLFPIALGLLGQLSSGILYSDLLLPLMLLVVFLHYKQIPRGLILFITLLMLYSCYSIVLSVAFYNNNYIYGLMLIARTSSFFLILSFYIIAIKDTSINLISNSLRVILIGSLIVTIENIISGSRAYYGYSQLAASEAPAISGFLFGTLSIYFFVTYWDTRKFVDLISFILSLTLSFLTYSISGNVSLIGALASYIALTLISTAKENKLKLALTSFTIIFSLGILLSYDYLIEQFARLLRLTTKLDGRLAKASRLTNDLCNDLYCTIFGIGPGGHSSYNRVSLGEGSILAFDQLYGRLLLEYGWLGFLLWALLFLWILDLKTKKKFIKYDTKTIAILIFGLIFGMGSEFIFVAYSGSIYAVIVGIFIGLKALENKSIRN